MKKITKNTILIIVGIILGCSIGVYATTILASEVEYTNNEQENVQGAIDDLYSKTLYLGKIKIGDYVKMTPTLTSYTILSSDTGYSTNQTINPSELNIWRIISINSDGTADAVSEYVSSKDVYFYGQTGYKNYVGTLNKIASTYTNSNYVVKTRHMGYNGQTAILTNVSKTVDSTNTTPPWSSSTSSETIITDEQQGKGENGYKIDYNLVNDVIGNVNGYKIENSSVLSGYWLASRNYGYNNQTIWYYRVWYISNNGANKVSSLYRYHTSSFSAYDYGYAIRPIITLKSGLTTCGGNGKSESTAWEFN